MRTEKPVDLAEFDIDALRQLQIAVEQEIKRRSASQKKEVLQKIKALAAASGYSLDELMVGAGVPDKASSSSRTVAPKYCHPSDSAITWTGRGKKPRWVNEALAAGKQLDDLLIAR